MRTAVKHTSSDIKVSDTFSGFLPLKKGAFVLSSTLAMILCMASTTLMGYLPTDVSALSITASAPSITALATSLASALVGLGLVIMLSIICVAMITGLESSRQRFTIFF